ncbi:SET and MYND domain-containing protein 3 [Apophysomyces ossiformis]|uniref:SET and MYND domain-containing protein 3 n=1 Tax=Apophysomyces ossiformis TaxID=679940 RepID=A0A8H7EU79_9FUNG|nr:SET and MYND domain-containing protein 3 [Apophysomyces ossiformis]
MEDYIQQQGLKLDSSKNLLTTSQYTSAGTTLLAQSALASIPLPTVRRHRCNYCLRKASLQCCSRCRSAYFCSNECFRNAWLHFHRVLCEPQESDIYAHVDADRWLLERLALTLHSHDRLNKQKSHSPPHLPFAIQALQKHTPPENRDTNHSIESLVIESLAPFGCQFSLDELVKLWQSGQMASFQVQDTDQHMEPVAIGIYPITSLYVRHSCRPNAGVIYKKDTQMLVALEDIPAGEPITISYVDLMATKNQRHEALRKRFGPEFVCECARCAGDFAIIDRLLEKGETLGISEEQARIELKQQIKSWNILHQVKEWASIDDNLPPIQDVSTFAHFVSRIIAPTIYYPPSDHKHHSLREPYEYTQEDRLALEKRILPTLHAIANLPEFPRAFTLSTIHAAEKLLTRRMAQGRWVEAARSMMYLYSVYRLIYPSLHPTMAYYSIVLARTSWNSLVQLELAGIGKRLERIYGNGIRAWIQIAGDAVGNSFGQDSSLWRELVELQWIYERDQKLK